MKGLREAGGDLGRLWSLPAQNGMATQLRLHALSFVLVHPAKDAWVARRCCAVGDPMRPILRQPKMGGCDGTVTLSPYNFRKVTVKITNTDYSKMARPTVKASASRMYSKDLPQLFGFRLETGAGHNELHLDVTALLLGSVRLPDHAEWLLHARLSLAHDC